MFTRQLTLLAMQTSLVYSLPSQANRWNPLKLIRCWLDNIEIRNSNVAYKICRLIPAQCPFARDVYFLGHKIGHIPPLCKLNPLYEQLVSLRFRALCYLADQCGEDIQSYC
ncbi:MAG: Mo-dependent nitrogenase C-terminal domain-containing protein [Leptolyngbyaceae cyanobacterium]